jgi:hypothetical protein
VLSLCLSRACLGKMIIIFGITWRQKDVLKKTLTCIDHEL